MPRPPNPLTMQERKILDTFVEYDAFSDRLIFKARKPEDFGTRDPERTANGFNRAKAGKPIGIGASGSFTISTWNQRFTFTENKARAYLGAPHKPISRYRNPVVTFAAPERHPYARGAAARVSPDGNLFDVDAIKMLIEVDHEGQLVWRKLGRPEWVKVDALYAERCVAVREGVLPPLNERARNVHNGGRGGRPVEITTAGVVKMLRVIRISPALLERVFPGAKLKTTADRKLRKLPEITDGLLAELFGWGVDGIVWKPRGETVWLKLHLMQIVDKVPDAAGMMAWNEDYAGRPATLIPSRQGNITIAIGTRRVAAKRIRNVVVSQEFHKEPAGG